MKCPLQQSGPDAKRILISNLRKLAVNQFSEASSHQAGIKVRRKHSTELKSRVLAADR